MDKALLTAIIAVVLISVFFSCAPKPPSMRQGATIAPNQLKGRVVTAKIDLPLRKGMVVYGNGEIDFGVYRDKLEVFGPSIRRYERARITKVAQNDHQIEISLNKGGHNRGWGPKGPPRWKTRQQLNAEGALLFIDYRRPITSEDFRPEKVAHALRDVLEISGIPTAGHASTHPLQPRSQVQAEATLLSVEARPSRVIKGAPLDLSVHFEIKGGTNENPLALVIHRQVYQGETPLFSPPRTQQGNWSAGVHSAHFTLNVPGNAQPGVYRFKAWLSRAGEEEDAREVLFEVLSEND